MKAKLNLDLKAIQKFLLGHVEKFVFGVVCLLFLLMLSGAMGRTGFDKTPQDLNEEAKRADDKINGTPVPPPEERFAPIYRDKSDGIRQPVGLDGYKYAMDWTPAVWPQLAKRKQPLLYTVEGLRGTPGHGAVRVKIDEANPLTSGGIAGQRWIVLTAMIPFEKQLQAYLDAFEEAEYRSFERDIPKVVYYRVQRAELQSLGDVAQPKWTLLNLRSRLSIMEELWNGQMSEVVNPRYIHQGGVTPLAFPLPPLENTYFGREVAYDPEIPLAMEEELLEEEEDAAEEPEPDEPPGDDLPPELRIEVVQIEEVEREALPHQLFRFFDFEVEPGKHYQYRVKLLLANPNYDLDRQFLEQDSLRNDPYLETAWSEPTEVVTVPRDARVLLGSVKPAAGGRVTLEPKASIGIPYFCFEAGAELYEQCEATRGKYLNLPEQELPEWAVPEEVDDGTGWLDALDNPTGAATKTVEIELPKVDFDTESVLLDMLGGERLPGRDRDLIVPGMALLLDPDGKLVIRNELLDRAEYDLLQPQEEETIRGEDEDEDLFEEDYYDDDDDDDDDY